MLQREEVLQDLEAGLGGFLGVKLHSHNVVALNGGGERSAVERGGRGVCGDGRAPGVRVVDEAARRDAAEQAGVGADVFERVPANVRRLEIIALEGGGEALALAAEVAEAGSLGGFGRALI